MCTATSLTYTKISKITGKDPNWNIKMAYWGGRNLKLILASTLRLTKYSTHVQAEAVSNATICRVPSEISKGSDAPSHQPNKVAVTVSNAMMMLTPKMNTILFINGLGLEFNTE